MDGSVAVGGILASTAPGEAKPLPKLRQSASAVVLSSEAAKPWRPPGEARNAMTLLPGEEHTEQVRERGNNHSKSSVPPTLVVGAAADTSPLTGEPDNGTTGEAAVITRVGDVASGSSTALVYQGGSLKEAPTPCATNIGRDALGTHQDHGGEGCAESKGDEEEGGSALPPISNSHCGVAVPAAVAHGSGKCLEAICCTDEHDEGRPADEPKLAVARPVNQYTASAGQVVCAVEGTSAYAGEDDLEHSDSRGKEMSRRRSCHAIMEDVPGSSGVLAMGACVDGENEPSTADRITTQARPAVAEVDMNKAGTRLETSNGAKGELDSIVGGGVPGEADTVPSGDENVACRFVNSTEKVPVVISPSPEQSERPVVEVDGEKGVTKTDLDQGGVFLPSDSFNDARSGFVFRLGDSGLGFYVDGYVDRPTKAKHAPLHRPWNAGPGDDVIRRAPIGPVHKPFRKTKTRPREGKSAAEEPNMYVRFLLFPSMGAPFKCCLATI